MTRDQQGLAAQTMLTHGGGFAAAIAEAWFRGDSHNQPRVYEAFRDLFERFAPTSTQGETK